MSYDFSMTAMVDTGTVWELEVWRWDTAPYEMVKLIEEGLGSIEGVQGKTGDEIAPLLNEALRKVANLVEQNPKQYQKRWWKNEIADMGKGAIELLEELKGACQKHGKATLKVSW